MSEQSFLWVIIFLSFDVPPLIYLFTPFYNPVQEQESEGYSRMWSIVWLLWAIRSQHFHQLSDHNMSCDRSRRFISKQSLMSDHILDDSVLDAPPIVYLLVLWYLMIWEWSSFLWWSLIWLLWALTKATMSDQMSQSSVSWSTPYIQ